MPCPARDTPDFRNRCPRMIERRALSKSGARLTWNCFPRNLVYSMCVLAIDCRGRLGP
jgi:hypothetical protein